MSRERSRQRKYDVFTIFIYILLVLIGIGSITAAVYSEDMQWLNFKSSHMKQVIWFGLSLAIGLSVFIFEGSFFSTISYFLYGLILILLVVILFYGQYVSGGTSWFDFGFFKFQPSEIAKFVTCLALAKLLTRLNFDLKKPRHLISAFALIGIPAALIIIQGDTGTALVFGALIIVLFLEGMPSWIVVAGFSIIVLSLLALLVPLNIVLIIFVALVALVALLSWKENRRLIAAAAIIAVLSIGYIYSFSWAFNNILKPHQQTRINVLFGKVNNLKEEAYNVYQSKIAIGSGGVFGKGYLNGTQNQGDFVPELSTDFIFCTIGEEFGYLGSLVVIGLFLILLFRILAIAERQKSDFSRIYAYGVAAIFFFHLMVNIGMTIGLVPVIGIPLPFISYGGSSLIGFTLLLFVLLKLDSERYMIFR